MFVNLNGQRIGISLGRWDARKALKKHITDPKAQALVDLVDESGIDEVANLLGTSPRQIEKRLKTVLETAAKSQRIALKDLTILELIDELGYSPEEVAESLLMPPTEVRSRYWRGRRRLRGTRHHEAILTAITEIRLRDYMAFEIIHVLGYSIRRASKVFDLNHGNLCRQVNRVQDFLKSAATSDPPTLKPDETRA